MMSFFDLVVFAQLHAIFHNSMWKNGKSASQL